VVIGIEDVVDALSPELPGEPEPEFRRRGSLVARLTTQPHGEQLSKAATRETYFRGDALYRGSGLLSEANDLRVVAGASTVA
jgi:hypothetical protein